MGNYKVKVGSEEESKEVQELLFELGYKWIDIGAAYYKISPSFNYITAYCEGKALAQGHGLDAKKEITIPQLKDMVVLKRNDISDATHCTESCGAKGFLSSEGIEYFWDYGVKEWNKHKHSNFMEYHMKPITKEPIMKEFLNKLTDGTYKLVVLGGDVDGVEGLIEVPEGGNFYCDKYFWKQVNSRKFWNGENWQDDEKTLFNFSKSFDAPIVWQRETLNDKVASAEVARQSGVFVGTPFSDLPEFNFGDVDNFIESNVERGVKHSHYKKDISHLDTLDIYRVTELFNPHSCGAHIAKKALCSGQRGHKDLLTDIQDIIDTAERWKEMLIEDEKAK